MTCVEIIWILYFLPVASHRFSLWLWVICSFYSHSWTYVRAAVARTYYEICFTNMFSTSWICARTFIVKRNNLWWLYHIFVRMLTSTNNTTNAHGCSQCSCCFFVCCTLYSAECVLWRALMSVANVRISYNVPQRGGNADDNRTESVPLFVLFYFVLSLSKAETSIDGGVISKWAMGGIGRSVARIYDVKFGNRTGLFQFLMKCCLLPLYNVNIARLSKYFIILINGTS